MVNINCNGRDLALTFRYNRTYNLDIPDPTFNARLRQALIGVPAEEREQLKSTFRRNNPRFMRVQRPLTVVELHEGRGKESKLIAKFERKLNHKDKPFHRRSPEAEAFRRDMIRVLFTGASQNGILSKDERKCFWDAINSRFARRRNPGHSSNPPNGGTPASARAGRPIEVVDAQAAEVTPDTIKPKLRLIVGRRIDRVANTSPASTPVAETHRVTNKVVAFPANQWHPLMSLQVMPWETRH